MAAPTPQRPFPLHAHACLLDEPDRNLVQHPLERGLERRRVQIDTGLATGDGPLHRSLQRERPSLQVEGDQGQTEYA